MELQVFSNAEFGSVRSIMVNDEPYFVGKDVAEMGISTAREFSTIRETASGFCIRSTPNRA